MQSFSTDLREKKRAMQKQLRDSYRSAQTASRLRRSDDVRELSAALDAFGMPHTKSDARHYAKASLIAIDALVRQGKVRDALKLLDPLTEICEEFNLPILHMQALVRLCVVLRRMEFLHDASFCADEGMELALSRNKNRFLMQFLEERNAIDSLVACARAKKMNQTILPVDDDEYPSSRLLQDESATWMPQRIKALLFRRGKKSLREPRGNGGKQKAVFVTTLLKKGFGPWVRRNEAD